MIQALWCSGQSPRLTYSKSPLLLSSDFADLLADPEWDKALLGESTSCDVFSFFGNRWQIQEQWD